MAKKSSAPTPSDGAPAAAPKGKLKLIALVVGAVGVLGAGGWFAFGPSKAPAARKHPVAFVDMNEITVNLASEPHQERPRFLKLKVALEVKDPKIVSEVQPLLPRVEDIFQVFTRELRASDLEGSGGMYRLREELLRRVNIALAPSRVDAVLFKEVAVQ